MGNPTVCLRNFTSLNETTGTTPGGCVPFCYIPALGTWQNHTALGEVWTWAQALTGAGYFLFFLFPSLEGCSLQTSYPPNRPQHRGCSFDQIVCGLWAEFFTPLSSQPPKEWGEVCLCGTIFCRLPENGWGDLTSLSHLKTVVNRNMKAG